MSELDLRVSDARAVPCATIFTDRWGTFGVTGWSSGLCFYLHWMVACVAGIRLSLPLNSVPGSRWLLICVVWRPGQRGGPDVHLCDAQMRLDGWEATNKTSHLVDADGPRGR